MTTRQKLAEATRDLHEALHVHPASIGLIERGEMPALLAHLGANLALHRATETLRLNCLAEMAPSLRGEIRALAQDLSPDDGGAVPALCGASGPGFCLGALYVVMGSQMGRKQVAAAARRSVGPLAPMAFLSLPFRRDAWTRVLDLLDRGEPSGTEYDARLAGARAAFDLFAQALDTAYAGAQDRPRARIA